MTGEGKGARPALPVAAESRVLSSPTEPCAEVRELNRELAALDPSLRRKRDRFVGELRMLLRFRADPGFRDQFEDLRKRVDALRLHSARVQQTGKRVPAPPTFLGYHAHLAMRGPPHEMFGRSDGDRRACMCCRIGAD